MTKLLFIIPPYFNADDYLNKGRAAVLPAFTIPYGVLSLEAYIKKHLNENVDIKIVDLNINLQKLIDEKSDANYELEFDRCISDLFESFNPDVIGISALFNSSNKYLELLAATCKRSDASSLVIAGGGLPSAAYEKILNGCPSIDAVCKGEGEIPLLDLLRAEDKEALLETHKSWICRTGLGTKKEIGHTFIQDLDEIPMLNYEIPEIRENLVFYNNRSIDKTYAGERRQEMAIHTSRGCPFLCVFCSNPSLHGRDVRTMSVDRVYREVKRMRDEFGMTVLLLEDDHFFNDRERAKEVLIALAKLEIRIEFPNGLAVYAITDDMAKLLSDAGVSAVALAVESGSDYVLNHIIKKPLKKKLIKPAVEALRKYSIRAHVFIVIGLPGEEDSHRQETFDMLLDNGFDWVHIYLAMPIFGSRLYDICVENGYIENSSDDDFVATKSIIKTDSVDPEALEKFAYEMQLQINFVHNYNMKNNMEQVTIDYMKNVVSKYPDHAFAHYYLSKCYAKLGDQNRKYSHSKAYLAIVEKDDWWQMKAAEYGLNLIKAEPEIEFA